mmetsp:Transcript_3996/g.9299  ORF Transcript_3996/g.9299 Transcript_3996/m.9299 type:complete len:523 (+) Transcript_3996:169-1737(+)
MNETALDAIQGRLEELLSKQNLTEDAFIQQNMNAQMYIHISSLLLHHRVGSLEGASVESLLQAAQKSEKLGVDEESMMIRPLLKPRRNTLILHDLPEDVTEEELRELFATGPEDEALTSVKLDVNHTAFAAFKNDEAAQTVALWLRSAKLRDAAIKCAVKSEHVMRSFFPAVPTSATMQPYMAVPQQMMWGSPWIAVSPEVWEAGGWPQGAEGQVEEAFPAKGKDAKGGKGAGRKRKGGGSFSGIEAQLQQEAFAEALQQHEVEPVENQEEEEDEIMEEGYKHEFRLYSRDDIMEVCNKMSLVEKPESYAVIEQEDKDTHLFREQPFKDWVPLPTPQMFFASSFAEGRRQHSEEGPEGGGRNSRKVSSWSRSPALAPRAEHPEGHWHHEGGPWQQEWTEENWGDGSKWKKKTRPYGGHQWVEKAPAGDEAAGGEEDARARSKDWSEKAPRWREKQRPEASSAAEMEQDTPASGATAAQAASSQDRNTAPTASPSTTTEPTEGGDKAASAPTWADKVRGAHGK